MANNESNAEVSLQVAAHVLVQLGEELVTDVEQAILECVKNAYDADAPGCSIVVNTKSSGRVSHTADPERLLRFYREAENVKVSFRDEAGKPVKLPGDSKSVARQRELTRDLDWTGSVVIEDKGDGLRPDQIRSSWLVISGSTKRSPDGKKKKTKGGRTPLGDKGVGRLGSMKLGDVLLVESATSPAAPLASAAFRWTDCETADTVSQIPVRVVEDAPNTKRFKGTRVSVLGLRDAHQWGTPTRALAVTRSLARLISPFEAKSQFPVTIDVDGHKSSLVAVTQTLLSRAVAEFHFEWRPDKSGDHVLRCTAKFKERLFRPTGGTASQMEKVDAVFGSDDGQQFLEWLQGSSRLKRYKVLIRPEKGWLVHVKQDIRWSQIVPSTGPAVEDPGEFAGAFYYFNLTDLEGDANDTVAPGDSGVDLEAAAGLGIDRSMVRDMAGISILRDGFRVRSPGDWLKISEGMTTGSTYHLRYHNTVGYFGLSGEHNFSLVEKSDREGFVENAALRGFMAIAETCKAFANESTEAVRRAQDRYAAEVMHARVKEAPKTPERSLDVVEDSVKFASSAQEAAQAMVGALQHGLTLLEQAPSGRPEPQATELLRSALSRAKSVQKNLDTGQNASVAVKVLRQEMSDSRERMLSLYESAAVGLSARGLAHELRTHIIEIRKRVAALESLAKGERATPENVAPHARAIRSSCGSIASAASLIDPLLPRTRAVKEALDLAEFFNQYFENRKIALDRDDISYRIVGSGTIVRMNRGRLLAVLDNLVRNSVYWLNRGAAVLKVDRPKRIQVTVTGDGFSISDSGPGIDPAYEDSIFEIFVTAKPAKERGQGLGLFIVTQLLAADGCELHLSGERNRDGRRYKFVVNLSAVMEGGGQ